MNKKALALATLAVSLVACGKETHVPSDKTETSTEQQFLEGIPAETPYMAAAVDPAPLSEVLPWLQTLDDAAMPSPERVAELLSDPETKPRKKRALAVLAELTGHYTPEGLQELGFSANPKFALYGIGLLPAVRIEIEDARKVGDFLSRVGERAGVESTRKQAGGQEYWTFPAVRHNRTIVMTIQDDVLLAGITTPEAESLFVDHLLGNATVEASVTADSLRATAEAWNFASYSVGFVDFERIAETFVGTEPGLNSEVWKLVRKKPREVSDACRTETMQMVSNVPRFVFGSESWSASSLELGAGLEVNDTLMTQLAATKTGAPLTAAEQTAGASGVAGFAFDLGKVVDILRTRAQAIDAQPFQCEWYDGINKGASALASRWSMLPPAIAQIEGGTLLVRDLRRPEAETDRRVDTEAALALSTTQPVELFDFVKAFNNDLFELNVQPTGEPIALPEIRGLDRLQAPKLFAQPTALALTSGDWAPTQMTPAALTQQAAPFIFINYDAEKIADQLDLDDPTKPFRAALRGKAEHQIEPTAQGLHLRSTYTRETALQ